jgi:allantoate deiminase
MDAALSLDVIARCRSLAACSDEIGATTRTFLSSSMHRVHDELSAWMTRVGMRVSVDAVGNLRGVHAGLSEDAPRLLIGSHLDTVPHAGAFDGVLGVVMGIALVESLRGRRLPFAIEVVGFSEEEGVRFGVPFIGSRALAGSVDEALLAAQDVHGVTVGDAIRTYGLDPERIAEARADATAFGYFEFHIEQGPVLDTLHRPIAVVDRIVGRSCADAIFNGSAGHAGTTPMDGRRDALTAAAEWIGRVEEHARQTPHLVATTGRIDAQPGVANVIPGRCRVSVDVRHADDEVRTTTIDRLQSLAGEIAARRGLELEWSSRFDLPATEMDPKLVAMLSRAVERAGATGMILSSGAGHDAMIMAAIMPAAMLFIRTPGGVSHHPDESVKEDDIGIALVAGANFLDELAATLDG